MVTPAQQLSRQSARKRTFTLLSAFLLGLAAGYGLSYLDEQASTPRLGSTEVFEVALPGGGVQRLSYAEFERDRQELSQLRQRLAKLEAAGSQAAAPARKTEPPAPSQAAAAAAAPVPGAPPAAEARKMPPDASRKNLGELFAKIFNQSMMDDLVLGQVKRQAGELTDVLDLAPEQQKTLKEMLEKRQKARFGRRGAAPGQAREEDVSSRSPEEEIRGLLTPEQARKYQEYTDKKNSLSGASALDKEVFELTWRLDINEEQETRTREILQEHQNSSQKLTPVSAPDEEGEASYTKRIEEYLAAREGLDKRTGEKMKAVLDPGQMKSFLAYQEEKDVETRLFRKLLQEGASRETQAAAP